MTAVPSHVRDALADALATSPEGALAEGTQRRITSSAANG